jgi:starvation-inducible DNA-binding protein
MAKKNKVTTIAASAATTPIQAPPVDIGISTKDRSQIAGELSHLLADTYMLYLQTHGFHWNVQGPMFNTLHLMFMDQYTEMWTALDSIAERIRALGHPAPGSYTQIAKLTSLTDVSEVPAAMDMVQILVTGHESIAKGIRKAFKVVDAAADESTADLLTQRMQIHEKTAWMLRSLLA